MPVFSKVMNTTASKTRHIQGFSLLELIIASSVALTILGASLGMLSEQRRWVLGDQTRATANDNLRLASDLIGQDIKQAGERLESELSLPAISIIPGASASLPSRLVLQRQLLTEKLPVCQTISAASTADTIDVSVLNGIINGVNRGSAIANCTYSYSAPAGGELSTALTTLRPTDNLRAWRTFRCTQDGPAVNNEDPCASTNSATAWAYIHDPVNNRGEFFRYSLEENASSCLSTTVFPAPARLCQKIRRADSTPWQYTYTYNPTGDPTAQPQLYLLEEREYSLTPDTTTARTDDNILQLRVNRQNYKRIANQVSNFQVWGKLPTDYTSAPYSVAPSLVPGNWGCAAGGAGATSPNPGSPNQWYCTAFNVNITEADPVTRLRYIKDWQDLQGIRITLTGINPNEQLLKVDTAQTNNALKLSSEFFPRNVASK